MPVRKYGGHKNKNYGLDTIHREIIGRLDKVGVSTELAVKKFKNGNSWFKYLVVKNTNEKIMPITAKITK